MPAGTKSAVLRLNERLKTISNVVANLGAGLLAGAAARWFSRGLDLYASSWILVAFGLIWISQQILVMLQAEDEI